MNFKKTVLLVALFVSAVFISSTAHAELSLTNGSNAITTPNVATSITGFQIIGPSDTTTPVKLRATYGTLGLSAIAGVTMTGNNTSLVSLSGTVQNLNLALATLTYTRSNVGSDTLEVSLVNSNEVFFVDNGHLYKFVSGSYTWSAAKTAAEAQTAYGAQGYLATITSSDENDFVYTRISGNGWLGATDAEVEKTWKWATGPEAGVAFFQENPSGGGGSPINGMYHGWATNEPNDAGGEDCGYMYASQNGKWNDFPCTTGQGYVVEFGAPGSDPSVVATNISITTADVPAISTLVPANGATGIVPTANLVISFTKTVSPNTGTVSIYKADDDSLVEAIDVQSDKVTGTGTNTITINPTDSLEDGTQYYVRISGTAFKDSGDNLFEGITTNSVWRFTTTDVNAPIISNVVATPSQNAATITWDTNELASTRISYSQDSSFGTTTSETNTNPRVTNHEVVLSGLLSCTSYNFNVTSRDSFSNTATSNNATFLTTGCVGGVEPTVTETVSVDPEVPGTAALADQGREFTVETPEDFTTESSVTIQIKSMPSTPVLETVGMPTHKLLSASSIAFNVTALIDNTTVLESFDTPVTVSYKYTDADIVGLRENTLMMYHYGNNTWSSLEDCLVDTGENVITCTAPHFSIFAIFGTAIPENTVTIGGSSLQTRASNLATSGNGVVATALKNDHVPTTTVSVPTNQSASCSKDQLLTQNLRVGARDGLYSAYTKAVAKEVKILQMHMNRLGFNAGPIDGILGPLTDGAIKQMQRSLGTLADGYVGPLTRSLINASCTQ